MKQAAWFKWVMALSTFVVGGTLAVNIFIDPANLFHHEHRLNQWKYGFDERLQKTAYLTHRVDVEDVDTLVFGSSRNTYYDQDFFGETGVFNYAFSNGHPEEYVTFHSYAQSLKEDPFAEIIIGLDYVGYGFDDRNAQSNATLIADIQKPFFWVKYISIDMLMNSLKTVVSSTYTKLGTRVYDAQNNTWITQVDPDAVRAAAARRSGFYYSDMSFDDVAYFQSLKTLRDSSPDSEFIIFTNPISTPFLDVIHNDPVLRDKYYHWVTEILTLFDEVYFFTWPNALAQNYATLSKDGDHYYKESLAEIAEIVKGQRALSPNGLLLTQADLDNDLARLRDIFARQ